ncbi:hypothetical protein NMY22_g16376 [Coprinellus aureogranulatus]|nr:hypothetical protein NMY22_g16376 [Coprinellus aureogranulatus]
MRFRLPELSFDNGFSHLDPHRQSSPTPVAHSRSPPPLQQEHSMSTAATLSEFGLTQDGATLVLNLSNVVKILAHYEKVHREWARHPSDPQLDQNLALAGRLLDTVLVSYDDLCTESRVVVDLFVLDIGGTRGSARLPSEPNSRGRITDVRQRLQDVTELYGRNLTWVHIHLPGYNWAGFHEFRNIFLQKQNQLRTLELVGNFFEGTQPVGRITAPYLEELFLSVDSQYCQLNSHVTFDAPALTKLRLFYPRPALHFLSMPYQGITYLSFGYPTFKIVSRHSLQDVWFPLHTILDFLQLLPSLVHLHFTGILVEYPDTIDTSRVVTLRRLRTLEVIDWECRTTAVIPPATPAWISLFTHLSTPSLEQFDWIVSGTRIAMFPNSVQSINHFLRPALACGSSVSHSATSSPSCRSSSSHPTPHRNPFRFLSARNYPSEVSPSMIVGVEPVSPPDDFIDRILEGDPQNAYRPVDADFPWPNIHSGGSENARRLDRLRLLHMSSEIVFSELLGKEVGAGPMDCERRMYITF